MDKPSEMEGLQFTARKIKWFDEDLKKMENMTIEERIEYKKMLREKHQHGYEDD